MHHGTGGLNVDGCRVAGDVPKTVQGLSTRIYGGGKGLRSVAQEFTPNSGGRYPPNLLLTHDEGCDDDDCAPWCPIRMLDEQSGQQKDGVAVKRNLPPEGARNGLDLQVPATQRGPDEGYGGGGGASRFFPRFRYQAKPSRAEREAGLEAFPLKSAKKWNEGGIQGRRDAKADAAIADAEVHSQGLDARGRTLIRADGSKTLVDRFIPQHRANIHTTVKPIKLMRWLIRLVTPPGGLVIDPFTGSGTTGCGAMLEGARFAGSEQNEEYARIARARIAHWAGEQYELEPLGTAAPPVKPTAPDPQLSLF
ncbi:MAG TPA: site-specific DNA-methyltransferase [Aurantimonas coralicida]|nr:site-specific DNA-methyltransferase [Aurantimonas coralicida]